MRRLARTAQGLLLAACVTAFAAVPAARAEDESEAEKIEREEKERAAAAEPPLTLRDAADAIQDLRPRLRVLGDICTANELFLERTRIAEILFAFDPDDATARNWLGHRRQKNGKWAPGPWRNPTNRPEGMKDFEARRAPIAAAVRERLEPLLDRCRGWEQAGVRGAIVRTLVNLFPGDVPLRELNGEVQVKGRWVLAESAATAAGRERLAAAVKQAREKAAAAPREVIRGAEKGEWSFTLRAPPLEILSSVSGDETVEAGEILLAGRELLSAVTNANAEIPKGSRYYLLRGHESISGFLVQCEEFTEAEKKRYASLGSFWMNGSECVIARNTQPARLDSLLRQSMNGLRGPFATLRSSPPWLGEGLGAYLCFRLLGTHDTVFIDLGEYSDETASREVAAVASDWVLIARKMVEKGYALDLAMLTSLPQNSMTKDDGLLAYALAAYFAEGRPADLAALMRNLKGKKEGTSHQVLAETCGLDPVELQVRFVRWLRELPAK